MCNTNAELYFSITVFLSNSPTYYGLVCGTDSGLSCVLHCYFSVWTSHSPVLQYDGTEHSTYCDLSFSISVLLSRSPKISEVVWCVAQMMNSLFQS